MKTIKTLIVAFALCLGANAQTVSVADVEALPGETVAFSLDLTGGKADTYISLQFNVAFPATGFATTGDYTVSSAWKNASAVIGDVDSDGHAVVPVSSAEVITGSDVEGLLTVWFTVGSDVAVGEYDVTLSNITFGYGFTDKDVADDVTFKVKVVNAHTVVLDENSTTVPEAAEGVNVRVKRTVNANEWSTICLPFAMSEAQVKAAFGDDVQLGDFTGCEATYDETEENVTALKVNFSNVTAIEANHPYVIKVADAVTEFAVDGVDVTPSDELSVDMDENRVKMGGKWFYFYNSFIGSYVADTELPVNSLFLSGSKFWYATENTQHMKAFRGYFDFYDMLSEVANAASRIVMSFGGDNMTGITNIDNENDGRYYNLQGMPVEIPTRGMYIRNGKVVIVKQ